MSTEKQEARLSTLQTMSPTPLNLLKVIPGTIKKERELHKKFVIYKHHGEWFCKSKFLLGFIEEVDNNAKSS